ncbi:MAG: MerR family transcriptional regulator [Acidobacteriota bacterium]
MTRRREGDTGRYRISAVAARFGVHPQTLRLYEREGLLSPSRSAGNTRFYTRKDLETLEVILHLTRDLGVNLAGVDIVLNMRRTILALRAALDAATPTAGDAALVPVSSRLSLTRIRTGPDSFPIDSGRR